MTPSLVTKSFALIYTSIPYCLGNREIAVFSKIAQAGGRTWDLFSFSFIFCLLQHLRQLGYCALALHKSFDIVNDGIRMVRVVSYIRS